MLDGSQNQQRPKEHTPPLHPNNTPDLVSPPTMSPPKLPDQPPGPVPPSVVLRLLSHAHAQAVRSTEEAIARGLPESRRQELFDHLLDEMLDIAEQALGLPSSKTVCTLDSCTPACLGRTTNMRQPTTSKHQEKREQDKDSSGGEDGAPGKA